MPLIEPKSRCHDFNRLDYQAETFYWRLRTHLDDYGRFHADVLILKSTLFPLRKDIRDTDISRWLESCKKAGVVRCYLDTRGRSIVEVPEAKQSRKKFLKTEFDPPEGQLPLLPMENAKCKMQNGKGEKDRGGAQRPPYQGKNTEEKRREGNGDDAHTPDRGKDGGTVSSGRAWQEPDEIRNPKSEIRNLSDVPDEKAALSQADTRAIPADFARLCFLDWSGNNGCDSNNRPKAWLTYVEKRWRYEQEDWKSGKHRGKKSEVNGQRSDGVPTMGELKALAKEKWGDDDRWPNWAVSFYAFWADSRRMWKRNGVVIDWKVELSQQVAKWKAG